MQSLCNIHLWTFYILCLRTEDRTTRVLTVERGQDVGGDEGAECHDRHPLHGTGGWKRSGTGELGRWVQGSSRSGNNTDTWIQHSEVRGAPRLARNNPTQIVPKQTNDCFRPEHFGYSDPKKPDTTRSGQSCRPR